jgi:enoyl-CoA hydratase/carnithine racemase
MGSLVQRDDLKTADGVRCVVLRGASKCFSASHGLADIAAFAGNRG